MKSSSAESAGDVFAHDCVVLDAATPDDRSPVRIFVGSEDGQWRAERALLWSIEQVRDPSRVYQIHLMKNLPGFRDRHWLTGFTNYRFIIPHLTGARGRAVYNDVDQIYLADPAELFDLDMRGHGVLSINERDTSVMLIDTERMASVWTLERARRERRKRMERRAAQIGALWGELDPGWNSRDTEYHPARSKLVHFTTIHTQPWMPFPASFTYQRNSVGGLWFDLERGADEAGFSVFSETSPSLQYQQQLARLRSAEREPDTGLVEDVAADREAALSRVGATSVLECGLATLDAAAGPCCEGPGRNFTRFDPATRPFGKKPSESFDAVIWTGGLEGVPDADLPWLIEGLFQFARKLVHVSIQDDAPHRDGSRSGWPRDRFFWSQRFAAAAARHPEVDWRIVAHRARGGGRDIAWLRARGRARGGSPRVWLVVDGKPGHTSQSLGLADALGWPYELKQIRTNKLNRVSNRLLGATRSTVARAGSDPLAPPWPDLVIATGRRTAPIARWISKQGRGHPRVVLLGRKGGDIVEAIDLAVTCSHFRLLPHPRRLETLVPINGINDSELTAARIRWRHLLRDATRGPVVLLAGGSSAHHKLDSAAARQLGRDVVEFAAGREVLAITSPRTSRAAAAALAEGLGDRAKLRRFDQDGAENPYLGYLALADAIVATGESESMLGEAVAAGVPVYIYPIAKKWVSPIQHFGEWVRRRAHARPKKRRKGSVRPQQGMEAFWSRVLARGFVRIHRNLDEFHRSLVQRGIARMFGAPLETGPTKPLREVDAVVGKVREIMSLPPSDGPHEQTLSLGAAALSPAAEVSSRVVSAVPSIAPESS